jgi:predicted PolB exonuclease-like 3'-5' exonuclease
MSTPDSNAEYPLVADLNALAAGARGLQTAFAVVRRVRRGETRAGKPYFELKLADRTRTVAAKVWSDAGRAMAVAEHLAPGDHVKLLFETDEYQGKLQLSVRRVRLVEAGEADYDPSKLVDDGYDLVADILMDTVVFDIETVPATDLRKAPPTIAQAVTKYADRQEWDETKVMSLSPYFGQVVSLAVGDGEAPLDEQAVTVFVVPPPDIELGDLPDYMRPVSEADLLRAFWALAGHASCVVSYNGRGFDVPFMIGRSLIHEVPVRVDLQGSPFAMKPHCDLFYALGGRGGSRGPSSLDVVCWALGLSSPKEDMDGSMVATFYAKGDVARIAQYNAGDVRATTAVYQRARDGLLRFRDDW